MLNSGSGSKTPSFTGAGLTGIMLVTDSMFFIFARLLQEYLPPQLSILYSMTLGTLMVVGYAAYKKRLHFKILSENLGFFMLIGFLIALSSNLNYVAVNYIDPGIASILNQSSIVFGLFWGLVWLREKLSRRQVFGAVIAIVGVVFITFQKGDYLRIGSLMVVLSSISYSFHSAVVKKYGDRFDFLEFFSFRLICNCLFLFLWAVLTIRFVWPPISAWPVLLVSAVVEVCISRPLYYLVLRRISFSILSILLTLSPILTVIFSLFIFKTSPTWLQLAGGTVVITGVLVMTGFSGKMKKPVEEEPLISEGAAKG